MVIIFLCVFVILWGYFVGFPAVLVNLVLYFIFVFNKAVEFLVISAEDLLLLPAFIVYIGIAFIFSVFVLVWWISKIPQEEKLSEDHLIYFYINVASLIFAIFMFWVSFWYCTIFLSSEIFGQLSEWDIDMIIEVLYNFCSICASSVTKLIIRFGDILFDAKLRQIVADKIFCVVSRPIDLHDFFLNYY